jgi:hypothetical protein
LISWRSSSNVAGLIIPVSIATRQQLATARGSGVAIGSTRMRFCAAPVVLNCPFVSISNAGPCARSAERRLTRAANRIIPCTSKHNCVAACIEGRAVMAGRHPTGAIEFSRSRRRLASHGADRAGSPIYEVHSRNRPALKIRCSSCPG